MLKKNLGFFILGGIFLGISLNPLKAMEKEGRIVLSYKDSDRFFLRGWEVAAPDPAVMNTLFEVSGVVSESDRASVLERCRYYHPSMGFVLLKDIEEETKGILDKIIESFPGSASVEVSSEDMKYLPKNLLNYLFSGLFRHSDLKEIKFSSHLISRDGFYADGNESGRTFEEGGCIHSLSNDFQEKLAVSGERISPKEN